MSTPSTHPSSPAGTLPPVPRGCSHDLSSFAQGCAPPLTTRSNQSGPLLSTLPPFLPQSRASPGSILGLTVSHENPLSAAVAACCCWGHMALLLQTTVLTLAALSNKWAFFQGPRIPKWWNFWHCSKMHLFFNFIFLVLPSGMWDLSSPIRDRFPSVEAQSLNHWPTRQVSQKFIGKKDNLPTYYLHTVKLTCCQGTTNGFWQMYTSV